MQLPNAPGAVSLNGAQTTTGIPVTWVAAADGGLRSGYEVVYTPDSGSALAAVPEGSSATSSAGPTLIPGQLYTIEVYAVSGTGGTKTQSAKMSTTVRTLPNAPGAVSLNGAQTTTGIPVTWVAAADGGLRSGYEVVYTPDSGSALAAVPEGSSATSSAGPTLIPGQLYTIEVYAVSGTGEDKTQSAKMSTTVRTLPNAPGAVSLNGAQTTTGIPVTWVAAADGGLRSGYEVVYTPDSGSALAAVPEGSSATSSAGPTLIPGQLYTIEVYAVSGTGEDKTQSAKMSTTVRTLPNAPGAISLNGAQTTTGIPVTWVAAADGGLRSGYEVVYTPDSGSALAAVPEGSSATSSAGPTLVPGQLYTIEVYAVSGTGEDKTQSERMSTTVRTLPNAPGAVSLNGAQTTTGIPVTWVAAADGGLRSGYEVVYTPDSGSALAAVPEGSSATSSAGPTLIPGQLYTIEVYADDMAEMFIKESNST
ncbi:exoglucanase A-like [Branchiostoma lanceolatum]|uniref:exoglucanase A-like n=1 Tax=Branchiostoma lanceolatum TaxID=7740 RepID=UPI0034532BEC